MISVDKDFDDIPVGLIEGKGYKHPSVIKKLKEIYHGKCAYCEEKGNSLQIMHYRPEQSLGVYSHTKAALLGEVHGLDPTRSSPIKAT